MIVCLALKVKPISSNNLHVKCKKEKMKLNLKLAIRQVDRREDVLG